VVRQTCGGAPSSRYRVIHLLLSFSGLPNSYPHFPHLFNSSRVKAPTLPPLSPTPPPLSMAMKRFLLLRTLLSLMGFSPSPGTSPFFYHRFFLFLSIVGFFDRRACIMTLVSVPFFFFFPPPPVFLTGSLHGLRPRCFLRWCSQRDAFFGTPPVEMA